MMFGAVCGLFIGIALIGAVVVGFAPVARGYILQGAHVLDLMVKVLSKAKTLEVEQVVTIDDPAVAEHPLTVAETLTYAFPDRFRSDTRYEQTHRVFISVRGDYLSIIDGKWQTDPPNRYDRYKDLLLLHSRSMIEKALFNYGIDIGTVSLGRFEDRIVYVIGACYPDETVSQVWVDKELFVPLRWLNVDPEKPASKLDFIFRRWRKNDKLWYPTYIETLENNRLIRTIQTDKIQVDPVLPAELWDLSLIKNSYPPVEPSPQTGLSDTTVNEVKEAIESFQKKFEP